MDLKSVYNIFLSTDFVKSLSISHQFFTIFLCKDRIMLSVSVFSVTFAPSKSHPKSSTSPHSGSSTQNSQNGSSSHPKCNFCSHLGHLKAKCFLKKHLMCQINPSSSSTAAPAFTLPQSTSDTPQSASAASPSALFSAFQAEAHTFWNVDTGASAHITFNHHWMCNLKLHHIQIRLADGSVVYLF